MRIGVIGSGNVGMALARGLAEHGHDVMLGTRDPSKPVVTEWLEEAGRDAHASGGRQAAEFGELVVIAVPGVRLTEVVERIGPNAFAGKILLDPTNSVDFTVHGPEPVFPGSSAAEYLQESLPDVRVVKALNTISADRMLAPDTSTGTPQVRIAGNDVDAKRLVTGLLESYGWHVKDLGDVTHARELEESTLKWARKRFEGS